MAELARLHGSGTLAQIDHLAQTEEVPANFLAQILGKLRDHGLITSRRGNQGGYILARSPDEISLHDILIAVEGQCLHLSGNFHWGRGLIAGLASALRWRNRRSRVSHIRWE